MGLFATLFKMLLYLGPFIRELVFGSPEVPNTIRRHKFTTLMVMCNIGLIITFVFFIDVTIGLGEELAKQRKLTAEQGIKILHLEMAPAKEIIPPALIAQIDRLEKDVAAARAENLTLMAENRALREELNALLKSTKFHKASTKSRLHELNSLD